MWLNRGKGRVARDKENPPACLHVFATRPVCVAEPEKCASPAAHTTSSLATRPSSLINASGFTMLELVVVIIIISILGLFAMNRFWSLRIAAERASVKQVTGNIRSALGMEVARYALDNRLAELPRLDGSNPMLLLAQTPVGYIGESAPDAAAITDGSWYFDPGTRTLNYRVSYRKNFDGRPEALPPHRWRITLVYRDRNNNQRFDPDLDAIGGLDLVSLAH